MNISMDVLVRICQELDCTLNDIVVVERKESNAYEVNK